ncbi:MAG: YhbY family RNA-binding protein [Verrucomicrobiia bacterium]
MVTSSCGMTQPILTGADRRSLRAQGQLLTDLATIGHQGITDAVKAEVNVQLERHQLIKVRATELDRNARKALFEQIAESSNAALIGTVGRTALLYRPNAAAEEA